MAALGKGLTADHHCPHTRQHGADGYPSRDLIELVRRLDTFAQCTVARPDQLARPVIPQTRTIETWKYL